MITTILITGCWDKVEIDKRAFVLLVGVDKFEQNEEDGKINKNENSEEIPPNRYRVTFAYPNTGVFAGKGEGDPKFSYTSVGVNIDDTIENLGTRMDKTLFYRHTKAIILGKDVAKDERLLREMLDVIERSPQVGRKVHLLVAKEKAQDIIRTEAKSEPVLGLYIRELMEQRMRTAKMVDADLGYILRSLHESHAAIIPIISSSKDEFKIVGMGILKGFKMVGELSGVDAKNIMFMFDKVKRSILNVKVDDLIVALDLTEVKTKKRVYEKNGHIYTSFHIETEGNLEQHLFEVKAQPLDNQYIQKIEKVAEKYLEEQIKTTYKKIQKDFGADLIQAGEYLRKYEPDVWKEVKDDWAEIYPKTKVEVHAEIKIRRIGVTQ
jgi:Ger(x)C family germination protein